MDNMGAADGRGVALLTIHTVEPFPGWSRRSVDSDTPIPDDVLADCLRRAGAVTCSR
jgi:hypothetical protein